MSSDFEDLLLQQINTPLTVELAKLLLEEHELQLNALMFRIYDERQWDEGLAGCRWCGEHEDFEANTHEPSCPLYGWTPPVRGAV